MKGRAVLWNWRKGGRKGQIVPQEVRRDHFRGYVSCWFTFPPSTFSSESKKPVIKKSCQRQEFTQVSSVSWDLSPRNPSILYLFSHPLYVCVVDLSGRTLLCLCSMYDQIVECFYKCFLQLSNIVLCMLGNICLFR